MPVFTKEQFEKINREVEDYFNKNIASQVQEIDKTSIKVVTERTPVYLREEAQRISSYMKYYFAIGEPIKIMVESKFLCCDYHPNEMPAMHIVLNDN